MNIAEYILCLFFLGIPYSSSLNLTPSAIVKTLHKGAYEAVKETVNTVTNAVGTPVDIKDVHFFLHTSKDHGYPNHTVDPLEPEELATRKGRVYFLIHGWTQSREKTPWYRPLTEYLLRKHPEAHIVQIDWSKAAASNYASAAFGTESVGYIIGDVIKKLVVDYDVPKKNIVVIGHSLGGQISGWVGKRFRKLTNSTLPRIIALDPAGPLFSSRPEDKRLNKHDADIVMVLHSDGGKLGFGSQCGSIDFFPNGGSDQPGCYKVDLADVSTLTEPIWCDHQRGYDLFLEAIKSPCLFLARKCEDYDKFKENKCENIEISLGDLEASSAGSYYFKTTDKAPFIEINELKKNVRNLIGSSRREHGIEECSQLLKREGNANEKNEEVKRKENQNHNENSNRYTKNNHDGENKRDEKLVANKRNNEEVETRKNHNNDEKTRRSNFNTNNNRYEENGRDEKLVANGRNNEEVETTKNQNYDGNSRRSNYNTNNHQDEKNERNTKSDANERNNEEVKTRKNQNYDGNSRRSNYNTSNYQAEKNEKYKKLDANERNNEEMKSRKNQNYDENSRRSNYNTNNYQNEENERDEKLVTNEGHSSRSSQRKPVSSGKHKEELSSNAVRSNTERENFHSHSSNDNRKSEIISNFQR